jgi:flagellar motor switch protein FliG
VREFFGLLRNAKPKRGNFLLEMLEGAVGKPKSQEMMGQVRSLVSARDPFLSIRNREAAELAAALEGESGQVAALILSELPPKKSGELLNLLDEQVRAQAMRGMMAADDVPPETRQRVAALVQKRLAEQSKGTAAPVVQADGSGATQRRDVQLRKVALLLRGLRTEARDSMVKVISDQNPDTGKTVMQMMVLWEDVPAVADRPMQEILRMLDAQMLALSLVEAEPAVSKKIRDNISERAVALLDEETSLLSNPKPEEIEASRQKVLGALRDLNAKGELTFEES